MTKNDTEMTKKWQKNDKKWQHKSKMTNPNAKKCNKNAKKWQNNYFGISNVCRPKIFLSLTHLLGEIGNGTPTVHMACFNVQKKNSKTRVMVKYSWVLPWFYHVYPHYHSIWAPMEGLHFESRRLGCGRRALAMKSCRIQASLYEGWEPISIPNISDNHHGYIRPM